MSTLSRDLTVAILAGGLGTRLRSVVADCPKVLAPVLGRPYLTYVLDQVAAAGVQEVILLAGYGAEQLCDELGDSYGSLRLLYSVEPSPLGTAGAVRRALPFCRTQRLMLLNGDSYCDVDLAGFWQWHSRQAARVSLVLSRVPDTSRFGRITVNESGRVERFEEKIAGAGPGWINAGIHLLECDLLSALPAGRVLSLEREVLPGWVAHGLVRGYRSHGRFLDIGTPESYAEAEDFFAAPARNGSVPVRA